MAHNARCRQCSERTAVEISARTAALTAYLVSHFLKWPHHDTFDARSLSNSMRQAQFAAFLLFFPFLFLSPHMQTQRHIQLRWCLITDLIHRESSHNVTSVMQSLMEIPTCFESKPHEELLTDLALRQNIKGVMVQPLHTLAWVNMVVVSVFPSGVDPALIFTNQDRSELLAAFERLLQGYHVRLETEGVDVDQPAAKKQRRSRRPKSDIKDSPEDQDGVKIGTSRAAAIRNIITHMTPDGWRLLERHFSWCQGPVALLCDCVCVWSCSAGMQLTATRTAPKRLL